MNLTPEQKKHILSIFTAHLSGEKCEVNSFKDEWTEQDPIQCSIHLSEHPDRWRVAPKPVTRPWNKPEDVPGPVCWLRSTYHDGTPDYRMSLIVGFAGDVSYITATCGCDPVLHSQNFSDTRWENMQYSTDRKTWLPCTVTEEVKP